MLDNGLRTLNADQDLYPATSFPLLDQCCFNLTNKNAVIDLLLKEVSSGIWPGNAQ